MPLVLQLAGDPTVGTPWCDVASLSNCAGCEDVDLASVIAAASEMLHIFSGRRYGTRRVTIRPTHVVEAARYTGIIGSWLANGTAAGPWLDLRGYGAEAEAQGYRLNGPVQEIHAVKLDGVTLTGGTDYHVFDGRDLVRLATNDGARQLWPCGQRLDIADTQPGTWSVDYTWGKPVPYGGVLAAQAFACTLAKLVAQGKCGIPDRASSVNRQGVSITLLDPKEFARDGRTGIRVVDLWLSAVNPSGGRRRSRIMGPDTPTGAIT